MVGEEKISANSSQVLHKSAGLLLTNATEFSVLPINAIDAGNVGGKEKWREENGGDPAGNRRSPHAGSRNGSHAESAVSDNRK